MVSTVGVYLAHKSSSCSFVVIHISYLATIAPDLRRAFLLPQPSLVDVMRGRAFFNYSSPLFHRGWRAIYAMGVAGVGVSSGF